MKRTFTLFLAALLLTGTLSGCNAASAAPSSSGGDSLNKEPPVMIFTHTGTGTEESFEVAASGYSWNWKNPSGSFSGVEADAVHPLDNNVLNFAGRTEEPFDVSYIISFDLPPAALSYDRWSYGDIGDFDAPARESERLSMPYHMTVKKGSVYVFHVSFPASDQGGGTADYYLVTGPDAVIPEVKPVMEASAPGLITPTRPPEFKPYTASV